MPNFNFSNTYEQLINRPSLTTRQSTSPL